MKASRIVVGLIGLFIGTWNLLSCAQQGSISGGEKDVKPPKFIAAFPDTLSLNVPQDLREIQIDFDELLLLKEQNKQVVISPPLKKTPIFSPQGTPKKYVRIGLSEQLDSATTYSIQFGSSIQDFNENNKLEGFKYVFSTGNYLDSLQITGKITDIESRKIPENILVALYKVDSAYSDTLVEKGKPYYIAKLDSTKSYTLDYLKPGKYRLLAYDDEVANLQLDRAKERVGFADAVIDLKANTTRDIRLFAQALEYKPKSAEQLSYGQFKFLVEGKPKRVEITNVENGFTSQRFYSKDFSDSIAMWFNPKIDSLEGSKSKRLNFLIKYGEQVDTLKSVYRKEELPKLTLSPNKSRGFTPYDTLVIKTNHPITAFDESFVRLQLDSTDVAFSYRKKSDFEHALVFPTKWDTSYGLEVLPGAFEDMFGQKNDSLQFRMQVGGEKQFGNLEITLQNAPTVPFWVQLLDDKDKVLNERYTRQNKLDWKGLPPGKYYLRMYADQNENQRWDTGDFFAKKQPEPVYIYPTNIEIKAYWDVKETWVLK